MDWTYEVQGVGIRRKMVESYALILQFIVHCCEQHIGDDWMAPTNALRDPPALSWGLSTVNFIYQKYSSRLLASRVNLPDSSGDESCPPEWRLGVVIPTGAPMLLEQVGAGIGVRGILPDVPVPTALRDDPG